MVSAGRIPTDPPTPSRRSRAVELVAWLAVAVMGLVAITQAIGRTPLPPFYVLQALTPYLLLGAVPIAVVAALRRRRLMALTASGIVAGLLWLVVPVVLHDEAAAARAGAPTFTLAHANAYFETTSPREAADVLLAEDADVMAITEHSPQLEAALVAAGVGDRYEFEVGSPSAERNGVALYSRYPFVDATLRDLGGQPGIDARLDVNGSIVRVLVVHPLPGVDRASLDELGDGLSAVDAIGRDDDVPTVIVGDFNASRWHPAFRRLLRHWTDAHEALGRGLSVSWPEHRFLPAFVRLDHALMDDAVTATAVRDVVVPGSDHRGFTVTLALRVSG
jgi:endonuclease/exonuclease/phosphatase (EEP) superfamily protein YafD